MDKNHTLSMISVVLEPYLSNEIIMNLAQVNDDFRKILEKYQINVRKIEKFCWNTMILENMHCKEFFESGHIENFRMTKKILVKCYLKYYPEEYLYKYPEFMVKKLRNMLSNDVIQNLNTYVSNMPNIESRTKSNMRDFFNLPYISLKMIEYTGW